MIRLQRITTQFIDTEDRVRISALSKDNETLILWLTQRLLTRLVGRCVAFAGKNPSKSMTDSSHSSLNDVKKSAPTPADPAEEAVIVKENCRSLLVREVDLKYYQNRLSIVFRKDQENQARLDLDHFQLYQWLTIIFNIWEQAEWPMNIWPKSIDFTAAGKAEPKIVLH